MKVTVKPKQTEKSRKIPFNEILGKLTEVIVEEA